MRAKRGFGKEVSSLREEMRMIRAELTHIIIQEVCMRRGDGEIIKSPKRIEVEKRQEDIVARLREITDGENIDLVIDF